MKTFTKHILLLALMLFGVAGAAWADRAPQKFTGPVDIDNLVVGDTLAPGFELVCNGESMIMISQGNAKVDGNPPVSDLYLNCTLINAFSYGPNGAIILGSNTVTPAYGDWQDGNAWLVTDAYFEGNYRVTLGGITIDLPPTPTSLPLTRRPATGTSSCPAATRSSRPCSTTACSLAPMWPSNARPAAPTSPTATAI